MISHKFKGCRLDIPLIAGRVALIHAYSASKRLENTLFLDFKMKLVYRGIETKCRVDKRRPFLSLCLKVSAA